MNAGKYNMKAVSTLTGIQPGTLRAWERRYHILKPVRNDAGHRLYTDEHIHKLKWLSEKVQQGFTISQAVSILNQQETDQKSSFSAEVNYQKLLSEELLEALLHFDGLNAQKIINKAFALYTIDCVFMSILGPLLVQIENLWEEETITTAHKHFAASILRSRIDMLLHSFPINQGLPKIVAVYGPGESNEMELLIFTFFVRRLGYEVISLGTGITDADMFTVTGIVKPKLLFISCTKQENVSLTLSLAEEFRKVNKDIEIGLLGAALTNRLPKYAERFFVGKTEEEWSKWLNSRL
ncbi:MerR family transcriptional regulator [Domibacillus epiphyticus]|uniref:MerR family transcriptional regulator n=1 Tax=Domibacillus epiphyticus TaxID=1714355 RepID=A0A1V2A4G4_9BACI|nr:MerR family transcriptional regulator [Domibacillus epiphyticus]OMP65883.1 MerR family transcriptional regulator [Domibacillus epiphyticus]